jgi:hypothetical protein
MRPTNSIRTATLIASGLALLSFLTRTFIDYRFVYAEMGLGARELNFLTVFNLVFYGGWIAALVAASHARRGALYVLMIYSALLTVFGVYTMRSLCPSPCRTFWPIGEIAIWSNVVIGLVATALAAMSLFRTSPPAPR